MATSKTNLKVFAELEAALVEYGLAMKAEEAAKKVWELRRTASNDRKWSEAMDVTVKARNRVATLSSRVAKALV